MIRKAVDPAIAPLGDLIARHMTAESLTLQSLASRLQDAGREERQFSRASPQLVSKWRTGRVTPGPHHVRLLARVLHLPVAEVADAAEQQRRLAGGSARERIERLPPPPELAATLPEMEREPADHEFIDSMRSSIQQLVALDNRWGGQDVAPLAVRCFRSASRRIGAGGHSAHLDRDLLSVSAELAELAGWTLHDAGRQEEARQTNLEGLYLARLAGDTSMELFILSNMACLCSVTGRSAEVLRIVDSVRAMGRLTNRIDLIFTIHEAISLAKMGRGADSERAFERARSLLLDGPTAADPAWSWWIDEFTLNADEGIGQRNAGRRREAIATQERALADCPLRRSNSRYFTVASLLETYRQCGAWADARAVAEKLLDSVDDVGSARTDAALRRTAVLLGAVPGDPSLRETAHQLVAALDRKTDGQLGR